MTERVKVFFVEPTDRVKISLRRFSWSTKHECESSNLSYCNAVVPIGEAQAIYSSDGYLKEQPMVSHEDPRWPKRCSACARPFDEKDPWQVWQDHVYIDIQTGRCWPLRELPPGACYDAHWYPWKGPDGRSLTVILPDGTPWCIDGRANNCTMPKDDVHKCWVRHGKPEDGTLHIDKAGNTCAAGAGSIATPKYHGFLHNGYLT